MEEAKKQRSEIQNSLRTETETDEHEVTPTYSSDAYEPLDMNEKFENNVIENSPKRKKIEDKDNMSQPTASHLKRVSTNNSANKTSVVM